jgi:hypothetical protein
VSLSHVLEVGKVLDRVGFRTSDENGATEYLIQPDMFKLVCAPFPVDLALAALKKVGALVIDEKDRHHSTIRRRVPELGRCRFYVISSRVFADADDAQSADTP